MLDICDKVFMYLNSNNIRYCHWKSNEHLDEALDGKTDLDILVHEEDREKFENTMKFFDIKEILSPPSKRFPGIYDFLGFDENTGRFIHLHVHYKLILGQKKIKNHYLPIEDVIFKNLILRKNIFIPCPELEFIILFIRAHMKTGFISLVKYGIKKFVGKHSSPFPDTIENEFEEILKNINDKKLTDVLIETKLPLKKDVLYKFIEGFSNETLRFYYIYYLRVYILLSLRKFRRFHGLELILKYIYYFMISFPVINMMAGSSKKTLKERGRIFSLVGADGSGKSTLINDLGKWLSWKLVVHKYYYGVPKSYSVKAANYIIRGFNKLKLNNLASLLGKCLSVFVARKRYRVNQLSHYNTKRREIVITDRFPMKQFHAMPEPMDGPRLQSEKGNESILSKLEKSYYDKIELPDKIFVLQVSFEELRKRKNDLDESTHRIKACAVNNLVTDHYIYLINADKPYSEVLLEIKKNIWKSF